MSPSDDLTSEERYNLAKQKRRAKRDELKARLKDEGAFDLVQRLDKCGQTIRLYCTDCGSIRDCETRCDIKWCPSCSHALAARTVEKYKALVEEAEWPLFVTWTTKNYDEPNVRPLRRAFGKLRRLRWFRRAIAGGITGFECTNRGKGWHWHAHSLLDCKWLSVSIPEPGPRTNRETWKSRATAACREVAEQWSLCTGRKSSVHVRRVWKRDDGDVTQACMEVLKYSVTAESLLTAEDEIAPALRLLDGTRLVTSFGSFFGKAPKRKRSAPKICPCGCADVIPEFLVRPGMKVGKRILAR